MQLPFVQSWTKDNLFFFKRWWKDNFLLNMYDKHWKSKDCFKTWQFCRKLARARTTKVLMYFVLDFDLSIFQLFPDKSKVKNTEKRYATYIKSRWPIVKCLLQHCLISISVTTYTLVWSNLKNALFGFRKRIKNMISLLGRFSDKYVHGDKSDEEICQLLAVN